MRKSRLSQAKQFKLIEHFVTGTTARCAVELVDVNRKTAAYYYHRLQEIIFNHLSKNEDNLLNGEIEVDESYFGGQRKGKLGRGATGKALFCLIKAWREGLYKNYCRCKINNIDTDIRNQGDSRQHCL